MASSPPWSESVSPPSPSSKGVWPLPMREPSTSLSRLRPPSSPFSIIWPLMKPVSVAASPSSSSLPLPPSLSLPLSLPLSLSAGGDALVGSGVMESLIQVLEWKAFEPSNITVSSLSTQFSFISLSYSLCGVMGDDVTQFHDNCECFLLGSEPTELEICQL